MLTANDVARYFLATQPGEEAPEISNLKLQKLCYYAQGFHLAMFDAPLFPEPIVAWEHGPVVAGLYYEYRRYGAAPIPAPDDMDWARYDSRTVGLLDEVARVYGQFSAWRLREMTHAEPPWRDARRCGPATEITTDDLRRYFLTQLDD